MLSAFRNVLVHDYLGIDLELVWVVATQDVTEFKKVVTGMLTELN